MSYSYSNNVLTCYDLRKCVLSLTNRKEKVDKMLKMSCETMKAKLSSSKSPAPMSRRSQKAGYGSNS
jgi:hypothetical protein